MRKSRSAGGWRLVLGSLLVGLLASPGDLVAELKRNIRFEQITSQQGLSQAVVNCSLQDRRGFMWFGTQEGLNRYDGYDFTVYVHDTEDPTSLPHDVIKSILEDRYGVLWVGTDGGGLGRFEEGQESFTRFWHDPADPRSLSNDRVRVIYESRAGELWVGTDGGGLNRLDRATATFERFAADPADPEALSSPNVRDLVEDRRGRLWVATEGGGVSVFDPVRGRFIRHFRHDPENASSLSDDRVRRIFADREGAVWVGTYDSGLNRIDVESGTVRRFRHDPEDPTSLGASGVWAVFQDVEGDLWVGTDRGLHRYRPESESFERYLHDATNPYSLGHDRVVSIYQDRGGVFWIGTFAGLNKWNPLTQFFVLYQHRQDDPTQLSNNYVTSLAEGPDGRVWVGTYGGGLDRLDRASDTFTSHVHDPADPTSLSDDRVMSLYVDSSESLWVGTFGGGLNRYDRESGRFIHFRHDPEDPASLSRDGVTDILEDRSGRIWVTTYGGGLNRLDLERGTFVRYRHDPADRQSLSSDRVMKIFQDSAGDLWLGTEGGGLNHFDPDTAVFTSFRHDPSRPESLSNDVAWAIQEDERGDLWIATQGGGLNRWTAADRRARRSRFRRYTKKDGLLSDVVYGVLPDGRGSLWLSTNRGLTQLDPERPFLRHFDVSHGLQSNEFNYRAELRTSDGWMFFGGIQGFNAFDPDRLPVNEHAPPVVLTQILKFNQPVSFERPLPELDELVLGHRDSVLAFEFAALAFAAPEENRYLHKLEGFDPEWVDSTAQRRATYTNLSPGRYTFRVKAANHDGTWNEEGVSLEVRALPPPWRTPWAYGAYAWLAGCGALVFSRSQARKRRRAEELARTNQALTQEIARRRTKEAALEREKERAQRYLDVAEVIMLVLNPRGEVTLINHKGCRILGLSEREILGRSWIESFVPEARRSEVRSHLDSRDAYGYLEYPILTREGEERIVVWHTTFLNEDDGSPAGTLCSGSDITQMRQLKEAKESAESASRAKSQFLANISHEIRTPMNGVLGMIELLLKSELPERQRSFADTARRSALHLLDLLNDILDFSKIEAGKLELECIDFDLRELVEDVVALFSERAHDKGLELLCQLPEGLPVALRGDPTRLRQILSNLLGNAVKFTEQGEVTVSIPSFEADDGSLRVRFEVSDTGIGFAPALKDKIFDSFHQADGSTTRKYGGTGLGLAITRELVEIMGGEIGAESAPGQGSTFWCTVSLGLQPGASAAEGARPPRPPETVSGAAASRAPIEPAAEGGLGTALAPCRILLAEDNPVNQVLVQRMLEGVGSEVDVVDNGREALVAASRRAYDVVLMDCQMPVMDGYEATASLRRMLASTDDGGGAAAGRLPIIAMTANAMAGDREKCLEAGMDDYLSKPFSQDQLLDCLRRWLPERPNGGGGAALESSILDPAALEAIRSLEAGGAENLLERVGRLYLEASPELVDELREAVAAGDPEGVARAAHSLKSSSANLGAVRLATLCNHLERIAREGSTEGTRELSGAIEGEIVRVRAALAAHCNLEVH